MSSYRGIQGRPDKLKAAAGVAAVHVALAAVILTGLNVDTVRRAVEQMQTIPVFEPEPPPPPPPPQAQPEPAQKEAGAPAERAEASPVVAPEQRIPAPSPISAAKIAGQGSAATSGAASAGSGTGAGGTGSGTGGGGTGGFTPVVLVRNLNRGDYRPLAAGRLPQGSAMVSLTVDTRGLPGNCRVVRSSGDDVVDAGLCPLITRRLRFRPARDASGRAIEYTLQYVANWSV